MHVGVKIGPGFDPAVKERAARAEALGYDSVWLSERVAVPVDKPHPYKPMADPWIGLAYVASVTSRVKLGTSVSQIALRSPVLMARELATLDRLSDGRLIVGAGAGWVEEEFTSVGIPFETRGGRLNEFIRLMRHLWTTPEERWDGKHFQVPGVKIVMPLTRGGPPVFIGASGPAGLSRVARYGDGFLTTTMPAETLVMLRQRLDAMTTGLGRQRIPMYSQAPPPESVEDARKLVSDMRSSSVDGIILAKQLDEGDAFPPDEVSAVLLEFARS
jgi:probable F420-dependent oxidoreductase